MCKKGTKRGQNCLFLKESGKHLNRVLRSQASVFEAFAKVGWVGLEPTTNALKGRCSTIELPTRVHCFECPEQTELSY
jgi:hypothetical protein